MAPPFSAGLEISPTEPLHPASRFNSPHEVVGRADLELDEKRAVLAAWASDACSVDAMPALRRAPGSRAPVPVDDVLEALRELDLKAQRSAAQPLSPSPPVGQHR